jgi:hypothetical protein
LEAIDDRELAWVSWKELGRGREAYPIHPDMIFPDGHEIIRLVKLKGERAGMPPRDFVVKYDREFVLMKLSRQLRHLARGVTQDDFTNLFEEIWDECVNNGNDLAEVNDN